MLETAGTWIGDVQAAQATTPATGWSWLDGTAVTGSTRWFSGEPNDSDDTEDGTEQRGDLFTDGSWNDDDCRNSRSYACAR